MNWAFDKLNSTVKTDYSRHCTVEFP